MIAEAGQLMFSDMPPLRRCFIASHMQFINSYASFHSFADSPFAISHDQLSLAAITPPLRRFQHCRHCQFFADALRHY